MLLNLVPLAGGDFLPLGGGTVTGTLTMTSPTIQGTVSAGTGLTLPAVTLGGAVAGGGQNVTNLGTLLIGSSTAYRSGNLEINNDANDNTRIALNNWDDTGGGVIILDFNKANTDTPGTYTAIATGQELGRIRFSGADGTNWQDAFYLKVLVTGTVGADRVPGLIEIHCYSDAATSVDTTVMSMTAALISAAMDIDLASGKVLKVNSTQVVGARVVDARCDDAINTGDATSDGVIDALRDAMIAHGLIAAA